ncbi:MAG: TlyA family RNA methyltransferase [Ruminococcus sp.]|nr:TlyA family RNA methyltransferase [Ruminococcus sp.]
MSKRLDVFLVEKSLVKSRAKAKELIQNGCVLVDGVVIKKPAESVCDGAKVTVSDDTGYVGRGALKLKGAFESFDLNVTDKCCADLGASTGGFTQVLLMQGAKKVYAIDVGHGQLAQELVDDSRVINCEGVNVRDISPEFFDEPIEFICGDLSFISLRLVIPAVKDCLADSGDMVMLIKPQFEAGKQSLSKKGIVRDKKDHVRVLTELVSFFKDMELAVCGLAPSAITGGDGNIEYLVHLKKADGQKSMAYDIKAFVNSAFENASGKA